MGRRAMRGAALAMVTLVALLAATGARANDVNNNILLSGGTNYFGAVHTDAFDFTDVFTFNVAGSVIANLSLTTIGSGANNIDFLEADLNGVAVSLSPTGFVETGSLGDTALTGPLVLTIRGKSGANGGIFASYAGTINVIPEPTPALLMGLGLGGLGLASRRARS